MLTADSAIRVTRCGCGTVHMTIFASGVTVRISDATLRQMATGLGAAVATLEATEEIGSATIN